MKRVMVLMSMALVVVVAGSGCSRYYKVRDPASGTVYYTDDLDNEGGGAILFKDVITRQQIRLSSSEVIRISKDQFEANIHNR